MFERRQRLAAAVLLGAAIAAAGALAWADPPGPGRAPDPPGQASRKQWVFDVRYHGRVAEIGGVKAVTVDKPQSTPRLMGRFAIELYVGPELLDRARFNVPLTADPPEPDDRRPNRHPTFGDVTTHLAITMADNPRAAYAIVVDRATGAEQRYWWPPEPDGRLVKVAPAADGGTDVPAAPAPKPSASVPAPTPSAPPSDAGKD
jgi:hypothetical protein